MRGFGSDLTAVVNCAHGPFFVKAVRNSRGGRRSSIIREKQINPAVQPLSPPLMWTAENEEWIVLGFSEVTGHRADFSPDSTDLATAARLVDAIGDAETPAFTRSWREERWDRFAASPEQAGQFRGTTLVHGDINPSNFVIGAEQSWVVDWAWPTLGAGFVDPACLVVQLVSAGHAPEAAEQWAARCRGWQEADPEAIDAFTLATVRRWDAWVARRPDTDWLRAMRDAAHSWAGYRRVPVGETE
ncbi:aminoglycoside phosphotransferase family protein [Streptomyces sp. SM12]|uniref:aminoglycoside phosphotransferase family protein n=1 Tax=Streptomyces sp. SM12 TaxID=1071602 RepID=UPI00215617C4|nr:aminoglycoside phosphotransferase family protein [Streptomyces sp. SM12]